MILIRLLPVSEPALLLLLLILSISLPLSLWSQYKTLTRNHEREKTKLYQEINTLNDRLMYLVGRAWESPPPRPTLAEPEEDDEQEVFLSIT
jgi:hypothetical protein